MGAEENPGGEATSDQQRFNDLVANRPLSWLTLTREGDLVTWHVYADAARTELLGIYKANFADKPRICVAVVYAQEDDRREEQP